MVRNSCTSMHVSNSLAVLAYFSSGTEVAVDCRKSGNLKTAHKPRLHCPSVRAENRPAPNPETETVQQASTRDLQGYTALASATSAIFCDVVAIMDKNGVLIVTS